MYSYFVFKNENSMCRFSNLRAPVLARNSSAKLQVRRQNAAVLQKASSKNLRLLKQMEKRSSVNAAALKIKKVCLNFMSYLKANE